MATSRVGRRTLLVRAAHIGPTIAVLPKRSSSAVQADPVVETSPGRIKGYAADGIAGFKGIPYAGSTAGANRFMSAQKPAPWAGVRDAIEWMGHSPKAFFGQRRVQVTTLAQRPTRCLSARIASPSMYGRLASTMAGDR